MFNWRNITFIRHSAGRKYTNIKKQKTTLKKQKTAQETQKTTKLMKNTK